jgi:hypothetical protein
MSCKGLRLGSFALSSNPSYQAPQRLSVRFGDDLLQEGFTAVPNLVLKYYRDLDILIQEMMFVIHIWQYWWSEKDPYPSLPAIATRMGISRRQAQNYVSSLKQKGYLITNERIDPELGQVTNEYDFSPLFQAVLQLHWVRHPDTPQNSISRGGMKSISRDPQKPTSTEEYEPQKTKDSGERRENGAELVPIWAQVLGSLESRMTVANYQTWLADTHPVATNGTTLIIGVPSKYVRDWLQTRFKAIVRKALVDQSIGLTDVTFEVLTNGNE